MTQLERLRSRGGAKRFERDSFPPVARLACQLAIGGRGTFTAWLIGAARRAGLSVERAAEGAYRTRRLCERFNARRIRWAWEYRRHRDRARPPLHSFEAKHFSQGGEDGIIASIFDAIGTTNRTFVEIGSGDGSENCTRWLAEQGWNGVWMEADAASVERARALNLDRVHVIGEPAAPGTLRGSLEGAGVPQCPDLLVVDIDGNDWWVLGAALEVISPRALIVEYNPLFPPGSWWVMPYRAGYQWPGTFRHGASLDALNGLARLNGLALVGCGSNGVNAFFVDAAVADSPALGAADPVSCYVEPRIAPNLWGHPRVHPRPRGPMPELPEEDLRLISMSALLWPPGRSGYEPGEPVLFEIVLRNGSTTPLASVGRHAIHVALQWRARASEAPWDGAERIAIRHPVEPGRERRMIFWWPAPEGPGAHRLELCMVQENTMWMKHTLVVLEVTVERHA